MLDEDVDPRELPNSGRSTQSIIKLANHLIDWTQEDHPVETVRDALAPPHIEPTPPGDPQPNPPDDPAQVRVIAQKFRAGEELRTVADSLARWLPEHPNETVAVLVPRNQRGFELVGEFTRGPTWLNPRLPPLPDAAPALLRPDESFVVYDHPRALIFRNMLHLSADELLLRLQ